MSRNRPGRNDPCPCGSGRKYKRCCGDPRKPAAEPAPPVDEPARPRAERVDELRGELDDIFATLRREVAGQSFDSIEQLQGFLDDRVGRHNRQGLADFDGLDPETMQSLLGKPFDSPAVVEFAEEPAVPPRCEMTDCFTAIVEAIDDKGLRLTAKGNLPRAVARTAAERALGPEGYREFTRHTGVQSEEDFPPLVRTHHAAIEAGLLEVTAGRIHRTRRCDELLATGSTGAVYRRLFEAVATRIDVGARDRLPPLRIIQQSFAYTLLLLQRYGGTWRPSSFYEELFARAYPAAIDECPDTQFFSARRLLGLGYRLRMLENLMEFAGLAEVDPKGNARFVADEIRVRATPQLEDFVRFHLDTDPQDGVDVPLAGASAGDGPSEEPQTERYAQFRIGLLGVHPMVWRRIRIPEDSTFWDLHVAIQNGMGWTDSHLHAFRVVDPRTRHEVELGIPDEDFEDEVEMSWAAPIRDYLDPMMRPIATYVYDFGDNWLHEVVLEGSGEAARGSLPVCLEGERRCPPEDVGGAWGYEEFLRAIEDPGHSEHLRFRSWAGQDFDPDDFDPARVRFEDPVERWREVFEDDEDLEFGPEDREPR